MSRCAVGDRAALGVLHSRGSSAPGTHQFREIITSTSQRRPAAGGARSGNHGPQGRVVEAGAPLLGTARGCIAPWKPSGGCIARRMCVPPA